MKTQTYILSITGKKNTNFSSSAICFFSNSHGSIELNVSRHGNDLNRGERKNMQNTIAWRRRGRTMYRKLSVCKIDTSALESGRLERVPVQRFTPGLRSGRSGLDTRGRDFDSPLVGNPGCSQKKKMKPEMQSNFSI